MVCYHTGEEMSDEVRCTQAWRKLRYPVIPVICIKDELIRTSGRRVEPHVELGEMRGQTPAHWVAYIAHFKCDRDSEVRKRLPRGTGRFVGSGVKFSRDFPLARVLPVQFQ